MLCVSVILSTYDKPRELLLALASIEAAARRLGRETEAEVVVADDGSGPETARAIEEFSRSAALPVRHARQEKDGFRLAAARNLAIRSSRGEILVFSDGDSLAFPGALERHAARCRPGRAHTGSRCQLTEAETGDLLAGRWSAEEAYRRAGRRETAGILNRIGRDWIDRIFRLKRRPKLLGGNCSVWRGDLERINGFDERFAGWGLEDDDLARRLRRTGVSIADGRLGCRMLHLFHWTHESHRPTMHHTPNYRYFHRPGFLTRCRRGLRFRPLGEIRFRILGALPDRLASLPGHLGACPGPEMPEVLLMAGGRPGEGPAGGRRRGGEIFLELPLPPDGAADPVADCLRYLDENVG